MFLLGPGFIAPLAHDWLHANSLYYWPAPQDGNATGGDIVWSSRHQDRIFKIDYQDGAGDGTFCGNGAAGRRSPAGQRLHVYEHLERSLAVVFAPARRRHRERRRRTP
jgi:hypothetical protein